MSAVSKHGGLGPGPKLDCWVARSDGDVGELRSDAMALCCLTV